MNELIEALLYKAGIRYGEDGKVSTTAGELKNLAELVIKECAEIAYAGLRADQLDEYDRGWQNGRNLASELIKEHFEIE